MARPNIKSRINLKRSDKFYIAPDAQKLMKAGFTLEQIKRINLRRGKERTAGMREIMKAKSFAELNTVVNRILSRLKSKDKPTRIGAAWDLRDLERDLVRKNPRVEGALKKGFGGW